MLFANLLWAVISSGGYGYGELQGRVQLLECPTLRRLKFRLSIQ